MNIAKEKIKEFLEILEKLVAIKIEGELKKGPRGFTMIISKDENKEINYKTFQNYKKR